MLLPGKSRALAQSFCAMRLFGHALQNVEAANRRSTIAASCRTPKCSGRHRVDPGRDLESGPTASRTQHGRRNHYRDVRQTTKAQTAVSLSSALRIQASKHGSRNRLIQENSPSSRWCVPEPIPPRTNRWVLLSPSIDRGCKCVADHTSGARSNLRRPATPLFWKRSSAFELSRRIQG